MLFLALFGFSFMYIVCFKKESFFLKKNIIYLTNCTGTANGFNWKS